MTTILVVCTANICRSPFAVATLRSLTDGSDALAGISVVSAGTNALDGHPICDLAGETLAEDGIAPKLFASHVARPLSAGKIDRARLILTAERSHRSAVNRLVPGSQSRTFTILEAGALANVLLTPEVLALRPDGISLEDKIELMNATRGTGSVPNLRNAWWDRRRTDDALSIQDGHNMSARQHIATFPQLRDALQSIAAYLTEDVTTTVV